MATSARNHRRVAKRRVELGQHFTPTIVSRFVVKSVPVKCPSKVIDLCVGKGNLLWSARQRWPKCEVIGFDVDPKMVAHSKKRFAQGGHFECLNILQCDFSFASCAVKDVLRSGADVVVANPPYGLTNEDDLEPELRDVIFRHDLKVCSGKHDCVRTEIAFFVRNLEFAVDGGYIAILLPESVFSGMKTEPFRTFLLKHVDIRTILSLPHKMFSSCEARTCLLVAKKKAFESNGKSVTVMSLVDEKMEVVRAQRVAQSHLANRMDPKFHLVAGIPGAPGESWTKLGHHLDVLVRGYGVYGKERESIAASMAGCLYLHSTCVGEFLTDERVNLQKRVPLTIAERHRNAMVNNGELLVIRVGKGCAGRCGIVTGVVGRAFISDCVYALRSSIVDAYYLCLFLNTDFAKAWLQSLRRGICSQYLTRHDLENMPIFLPPQRVRNKLSEAFRTAVRTKAGHNGRGAIPVLRSLAAELDRLITLAGKQD